MYVFFIKKMITNQNKMDDVWKHKILPLVGNIAALSIVSKKWQIIATGFKRHPIEAAKLGDKFNINGSDISRKVYTTLIEYGHIDIALDVQIMYGFTPSVKETLLLSTPGMIRRLVQNSNHNAHTTKAIGRGGPASKAYKIWKEMEPHFSSEMKWCLFLGLCLGGHLEELKLSHQFIVNCINTGINQGYDMIYNAISSGNVDLVKYVYSISPIDVTWSMIELSIYSGSAEMFHFIVNLGKEQGCEIDPEWHMRYYKNTPIEVVLYLNNKVALRRPFSDFADMDDEVIKFLYKKGILHIINLDIKTLCKHGHMKSIAAFLRDNPGTVCNYCNNRYHV
jgi:hypothetical protein